MKDNTINEIERGLRELSGKEMLAIALTMSTKSPIDMAKLRKELIGGD